ADAIEIVMTKRRPKPTIDELMAVLPGPDFPSGGIVVDDGLRDAYETGRGTFRIRAKAHVEQTSRNRQSIIVTELPYLVGPERVIGKVQELANSGKLVGIEGIADLSDMNGLMIQIDVKPAVNPQAVLQELYRLTPLEESFGINNVVLVDGVPTTLGLYDLCRAYIEHRLEVIVRRTQFRLEKAQDRLHILDMPLRRLTALAKLELEDEAASLRTDIAEYERLLGSEDRCRKLVLKELGELVDTHGQDRRAEIINADDIPVFERPKENDTSFDTDNDEPCVVTLSSSGNLGRVPTEGAKKGVAGRHDLVASALVTSTGTAIAAVTSEGRAFIFHAGEAADAGGRTRGNAAAQQLGLNKGEDALALVGAGE
ncbi:MAG: DNA topoisomerase IV, partial [Actinobacteria bacterium]|nr:DNA topoisomerase IV [Actinomycetota bacterium]